MSDDFNDLGLSSEEFLAEAEEIVEALNSDLMKLSESGLTDASLMNSIFRSAHTLKGLSGMFGFDELTDLSHKMEDLLDKLRLGKVDFSQEVLDVLFDAMSVILSLLELKSQNAEITLDVKPIVDLLYSFVSGDASGASAGGGRKVSESITSVLTEYEEHRLNTALGDGKNIFKIQAIFPIATFDEGLADITQILESKGEIISNLPTQGFAPGENISFDIIVATDSDRAKLIEIIDDENILVESVVEGEEDGVVSLDTVAVSEDIEEKEAPGSAGLNDFSQAPSADVDNKTHKSISQTVRVDIALLDSLMNIAGEMAPIKEKLNTTLDLLKTLDAPVESIEDLRDAKKMIDHSISDMQYGILEARMVPLKQVFDKLARLVRQLGRELNKNVTFVESGGETKLDKFIVEDITNPLIHIVRNSMDHGLETSEERIQTGKSEQGTIDISASQRGNHVVITVKDDGRGINTDRIFAKAVEKGIIQDSATLRKDEILDLMFLSGFSTKDEVSEVSGRGVGMDVVKQSILELSGMIEVDSEMGRGTKLDIILPMTLAIIRAIIAGVGDKTYAIPLNSVLESFLFDSADVETIEGKEFYHLRGATLPIIRLNHLFGDLGEQSSRYVLVVGLAEKRIGIVVDSLLGQQDIVIKSLGKVFKDVRGISGATVIKNETVLVLDIGSIIDEFTTLHTTLKAN